MQETMFAKTDDEYKALRDRVCELEKRCEHLEETVDILHDYYLRVHNACCEEFGISPEQLLQD